MNRQAVLIAASFLLISLPSPAQKKASTRSTTTKAIRFEGAPQFSQDELKAAAGLKPDARMTALEIRARAKQLNDTCYFQVVKFSNDSKELLFTLTPVSQLYPIHVDNLPLKPGKDLDDKIHEQFPLYHGQVPASGTVVDGIGKMFAEMLAAQGMKATVKGTVTSGLGPQKNTAMNYAITSPAVHIGKIQLSGVSAPMLAKAVTLVMSMTGSDFDTENTAPGIQHALEGFYQDQGYAAVQVVVSEVEPPVVSDQAIEIPYAATVTEGGIYKLGAINYPADALVPRNEVEKVQAKYQKGSGRPLDLFLLAARDAYHNRGYLDCNVVSHPAYNEATRIVNYSVEITPGAVYKMGTVKFEGAPDAMTARLTKLWKLAPGSVFDESYVKGFAASAQKQDRTLAKWLQSIITTDDIKPNAETHQVNCVIHFAKPAGSGK